MSGWDTAQKRAEEHAAGSGIFVRLADHGEKIVGTFCGDPHIEDIVWNKKLERYEEFTKEHAAAGVKPTPRYKINVYVPAEKAMKIWEMNNQTFKDVVKVKEKFGVDKWFFEIERNGKKGNTKTTYSILPDKKIEELDGGVHKEIMAKCPLHDLARAKDDESTDMNSHKKDTSSNGSTTAAPAVPETIDAETSSKIIGRLKVLPREKLDEFLKKFGVQQIKGLKKSDLPTAEAFLDAAEGKPAQAPAAPDPFG